MTWRQIPVALEFTLIDDDGAESTTGWSLPYAHVGIAEAWAAAFVPVIHGVSDCTVKRYDIIISQVQDDPLGTTGADVRRVGQFFFATAVDELHGATLPGIKESVLTAPGGTSEVSIDLLHPAVAAYVAAMLDGLDGVEPCDRFGNDLVALLEAYRQWR